MLSPIPDTSVEYSAKILTDISGEPDGQWLES